MRRQVPGLWERIDEAFGGVGVPQIAKLLGLSKPSIYGWRKGDVPWLHTLIQISELTNTSLHWLLTGEGPQLRSELAELSVREPGALYLAETLVVRRYLVRQLADLTEKGGSDDLVKHLIRLLGELEKTLHKEE